jgi:hypothetical protein
VRTFFLGALLAIISLMFAPSVQAKSELKTFAQTERLLPLTHSAYARGLRAIPPLLPRHERRILDRMFTSG